MALLVEGSAHLAVSLFRAGWIHPTGHPFTLSEQYPGLVTEARVLACHYLVLLVVHHLGHHGRYQLQLRPGRFDGDTTPMPWAM